MSRLTFAQQDFRTGYREYADRMDLLYKSRETLLDWTYFLECILEEIDEELEEVEMFSDSESDSD
tara:strand:- start:31 stop:225 length:195 start_codon:yes stop_codon:yes gene_type:complete